MRWTCEFHRSFIEGEIFSGLLPNHHIHRKSNSIWKSHRKLLQDLITQTFLHNMVALAIHVSALNLARLWSTKAKITQERPFSASGNIYHGALDAIPAFSFKENSSYSAIKPQLDLLRKLINENIYLIRSTVDQIVERENRFAAKEGRAPNFFSNDVFDEVFGFVIAGHGTTSTTLFWGLKYLRDNPSCTTRLRVDLQAAYSTARPEGRSPSVEEIIRVSAPYLDTTIKDILRCATTIAMVVRKATANTELLGHQIPKGTTVIIAGHSPSILSQAMAVNETSRSNSARLAKSKGRSRV
ncbi:cytochrome P450 [Fusarium tricinctum]|uniref:Cytochrome P450 n=1 Tax=Fusarium tricinctum TaxID=61284 RepID=A0A8K0WAN0_9HYPO|nr:cytochrome P450 [Fusarium tricinctum]